MAANKCLEEKLLLLGARKGVEARSFTSFRIGGEVGFFAEPRNADELAELMSAAKCCGYPIYVIGNGTNLLVSDDGVDALFIRIGSRMSAYSFNETTVSAEAGALLCTVAKASVAAGLGGMEWAAGIPGTIGGAVAMNAGAYGGEIKQILRRVTYVSNGRLITKRVCGNELSYRKSPFAWPDAIVVSAEFELNKDDGGAAARMEDYNIRRRTKQPLEFPSAGSTFKRPKDRYAGALIEEAGLKGKRIGGAMVSPKHAGFIVNCGGATFEDVCELMAFVQKTVFDMSGVLLEPEVKIVR
ncbi:MAG: UDP-N-acetylmuramate dehydrogenase [Clostridia bacterium]|nr:UDP-N-acetylmuramate dehydrogenase [Clostridia bacterium]